MSKPEAEKIPEPAAEDYSDLPAWKQRAMQNKRE